MLAAAPAKQYADPELLHHEYFKAAISTQQSAVSLFPKGLPLVFVQRRFTFAKADKAHWHQESAGRIVHRTWVCLRF